MATVTLEFSALPAQVRTARLLAVALGRRGGLPDELLDEVRLAVGEACSRAIAVHARTDPAALVQARFTDDERGFEIAVRDVGDPADVSSLRGDVVDMLAAQDTKTEPGAPDGEGVDSLGGALALAVIRGLVNEMTVGPDPAGGTLVTFCWTR